ncbi:hypothetical protein PRZ48_013462 [Zasmidium cellare]|uniref:Pre-mRNA-splicing factor 38B n=1 Tax=Zasmidium cellare TaxID=395010 RepID=A0ABR0E143_ZASCE|nr:hypothetical protein PRZ48_013462 [Zasmidium cellare]
MPPGEAITDDYVTEILKKDAQRSAQSRYLSAGLGSLLGSSRPRSNAPKPNTRFLRNIVKEADSHNAALRRKEEEESRERMRGLKRGSDGRAKEQPDRERPRDTDRRRDTERRHDKERRRHRSRSRSRSRSPNRERHRHKSHRDSHHRRRSKDRDSHRRRRSPASEEESDSDPLEYAIGPKPPPKVKPRGRGADSRSAMDSPFDPNYDPKMDVGLGQEEDGDDWDMALEALRDRAKWRKSGAERLKAAGFTDDEVAKWEKGGGGRDGEEKDISDVRWNKKGEGREWDRGKTVDGERVDVKAEWERRKD